MDKLIHNLMSYELNGDDVRKITRGNSKIMLYKELQKYDSIIDAIGPTHQLILMFPVENDYSGHWLSILYHKETHEIEHFDPYSFSWTKEEAYTRNKYVDMHLLEILYNKATRAGYKVFWNPYKFQSLNTDTNTCGRWATIRCRFHYLNIKQFAELFLNQKISSDYLVTILTLLPICEDIADEKFILNMLKT